jgi:hypothetical protein
MSSRTILRAKSEVSGSAGPLLTSLDVSPLYHPSRFEPVPSDMEWEFPVASASLSTFVNATEVSRG